MRHLLISTGLLACLALGLVGFPTAVSAMSFDIQSGTLDDVLDTTTGPEALDLTASALSLSGTSLGLDLVGVGGTQLQTPTDSPLSVTWSSDGSFFSIDGGQSVNLGSITGICSQQQGGSLRCDFSVRDTTSLWSVNQVTATPAVPEPRAVLLFALGCLVAGGGIRLRRA